MIVKVRACTKAGLMNLAELGCSSELRVVARKYRSSIALSKDKYQTCHIGELVRPKTPEFWGSRVDVTIVLSAGMAERKGGEGGK